ncbi:MAG: hypothetical protein A2V70_20210 [Planctomycetes bacterium RBG_13_63_9]|nr:MAG: hypothetical protein A2V70_20210 [Planctomycetes bacterium RBG_13_63_9]
MILFCEGYTKPTEVDFDSVRDLIYEDVHEKKQRIAMAKYFQQLQDAATIDNYLAGSSQRPQKPTEGKATPDLPKRPQVSAKR